MNEMPTEVSADIAALCSKVGLQASGYREFPVPPEVPPEVLGDGRVPDRRVPEDRLAQESPSAEPGAEPVRTNRHEAVAAPRDEASTEARTRRGARAEAARPEGNWRAVRWLLEGEERTGPGLGVPSLAVWSPSGGVGKTSILAGVGRALAGQGLRILLGDASRYSVLPLSFGARWRDRAGPVRSFPVSPAEESRVFLLPPGNGDSASRTETLLASLRSLQGQLDGVLLETGTDGGWGRARCAMQLVPLLADVNAVAAVQELEAAGDQEPRWYVLNQFDPAQPLQRELRDRLRRQLGERLLPFELHRDPALPEALAAGCSVLDYAPGAPICEDLMRLALWLRQQLQRASGAGQGGLA